MNPWLSQVRLFGKGEQIPVNVGLRGICSPGALTIITLFPVSGMDAFMVFLETVDISTKAFTQANAWSSGKNYGLEPTEAKAQYLTQQRTTGIGSLNWRFASSESYSRPLPACSDPRESASLTVFASAPLLVEKRLWSGYLRIPQKCDDVLC